MAEVSRDKDGNIIPTTDASNPEKTIWGDDIMPPKPVEQKKSLSDRTNQAVAAHIARKQQRNAQRKASNAQNSSSQRSGSQTVSLNSSGPSRSRNSGSLASNAAGGDWAMSNFKNDLASEPVRGWRGGTKFPVFEGRGGSRPEGGKKEEATGDPGPPSADTVGTNDSEEAANRRDEEIQQEIDAGNIYAGSETSAPKSDSPYPTVDPITNRIIPASGGAKSKEGIRKGGKDSGVPPWWDESRTGSGSASAPATPDQPPASRGPSTSDPGVPKAPSPFPDPGPPSAPSPFAPKGPVGADPGPRPAPSPFEGMTSPPQQSTPVSQVSNPGQEGTLPPGEGRPSAPAPSRRYGAHNPVSNRGQASSGQIDSLLEPPPGGGQGDGVRDLYPPSGGPATSRRPISGKDYRRNRKSR